MSSGRIHFLGVCGTAMGSVAAAMKEKGWEVTGSDENVYPPMSTFLEERGVAIQHPFSPDNLPADADWVVIGNAIKRGNPEVEAVLSRKLLYVSLPEALKQFFLRGRHNLVVTGTHGKTTTSSLLAWILRCGGLNPSFMIGGIPNDLGHGAEINDSRYFVIEGDEYDTAFFDKRSKFLHYLPELLIVNNIEFDHADIFSGIEEIKTSFRRLLQVVPGNGMVLLNADDPNCTEVGRSSPAPIVEVGFSENAGNRIRSVRHTAEGSEFELFGETFAIPLPGEFNVRNAAMAISAAHFYGVPVPVIREAVASFKGVRRRQEVRGEAGGVRVIDDFGHHPTAIKHTIEALRHRYPEGRLWAVFEPRSNTTRRAVFQHALPAAFAGADGVVLAPVARLEQLPEGDRLDPERVVADLRAAGKVAFYERGTEGIIARVAGLASKDDTVVIFSNGGFENIHARLLDALRG